MDSTNPYSHTSNFVDLLNCQQDCNLPEPFPYECATRQKTSGQSESDVVKLAHSIFFNDHKIKFNLHHAWEELRYDQKWCEHATSKVGGSTKKRKCDDGAETSSSQATINLDEEPTKRQAPQVTFSVNGSEYNLAYYLTDGIYPKLKTFIQSIPMPQGPKAVLFAQHQEAVRKDVERAFGVLQARFAIVKNPALFWDKAKIGKIMRACIILHNMIVEDERDGYTLVNVSEFQAGEDTGSSHVDLDYSTDMPTTIANMLGVRTRIRDRQMHQQLKADLVEHLWSKFGYDEDNN
uniref:No apical meristem-associated C-terminal domain-containing protein n=1 Tax=Brassica oleracea var. oleracea TaxID=109376 RepID=A0A0D3ALG2_BRAOL